MKKENKHRVCPAEHARILDFNWRKLLQSPRKILAPYVQEGMQALDLGCGPGFFTLEMARRVGRSGKVVAADLQEGMLAIVRRKIAKAGLDDIVRLHPCRPDGIGLAQPFDFILVFWMLHEVPDQARFLAEIRSLLKPGGTVLLAEPNFHVSKPEFLEALDRMREAGFAVVDEPRIRFSRAVVIRGEGSLGKGSPS